MNYIESSKTYTSDQMESLFFRPMLSGVNADNIGVRVLYNMPVPTTVSLWGYDNDVLSSNSGSGWNGQSKSISSQKTIDLQRVKAELEFSAADYYSLVFENVVLQDEVNLDDLTGTTLEKIETEIFRNAISESLRNTMWIGNTNRIDGQHNTFNGFLTSIVRSLEDGKLPMISMSNGEIVTAEEVIEAFDKLWDSADPKVRDAKADGRLVYYVSSSVYALYEKVLDEAGVDTSYNDTINGRSELRYHGIPVVDMRTDTFGLGYGYPSTVAFLTMRDNLVMAVNTNDFPGTEIRMWYNPDEMQNRQRATFAIGCEVLDTSLITIYSSNDWSIN